MDHLNALGLMLLSLIGPSLSRSEDPTPLRPQPYTQDRSRSARPPRPRTPSRVRPPRPRSPSRVRKPYTSNCARQRWPPSPRVEDETTSLKKELSKEGKPIPVVVEDDGVQMRGTLDQNPIVKDVEDDSESLGSTTSSEASASVTPPSTVNDNQDRRHVWIPEDDDHIPPRNSRPKNPSTTAYHAPMPQDKERGRRVVPRLDTENAWDKSRRDIPPPLERARSPYASGPKPTKPKEDRFSGEHMLSPEIMSPRINYAENRRSHSYYDPRIAKDDNSRNLAQIKQESKRSGRPELTSSGRHASAYDTEKATYESARERDKDRERVHRKDSYDHPTRPPLAPLGRHASAAAAVYPGAPFPPSTTRTQPGYHQGSSDESDASRGSGRHRKGPNLLSAQDSAKVSTLHFNDRSQQRHSSRQPTPTPPESAADHKGTPTNRASLLSGDFLLGINARLEHDIAGARRASPRPSPQPSPMASPRGSPTGSPFSSPPRTPPSEIHHRRTNTGTSLKNEVQRSRPPSPSSDNSTPKIPRTSGTGVHPVEADMIRGPRHAAPRSRMTTPLPSPPITLEPEPILGPGISIRSPSSAVHANQRHDGKHEPRYVTSRHASIAPTALASAPAPGPALTRSSTLQPGFSGRQRSASYTDIRPQLTLNTPAYLRPADSPRSPGTRSRPSSPSISSPSERYKPANSERPPLSVRSNTHVPSSQSEQTPQRSQSSRSRANSYVPEAYTAVSSPRSSALAPASSASDSVSRPLPPMSPSTVVARPRQPVILPLCPRPQPVAGYKDWYTLYGCSRFAICPDCRHNVFGVRYGHNLTPRNPEPHTEQTICDLNDPWVRLATQMTLNQNRPDLELLTILAKTTAKQRPCMENRPLVRHHWYRLDDEETGKPIPDFNVCRHCVFSLESIFPVFEDIFYAPKGHHGETKERVCSLRSEGRNFVQYINVLDQVATEAQKAHKEPNTAPLARLIKRLTQEPEYPQSRTPSQTDQSLPRCPRDQRLPNQPWHIHPHIPEFTICPSCYAEVVLPAVTAGHPIARTIDQSPHKVDQQASCHLYPTTMRKVFKEACEDDDFEHLRHKAHRRHLLQQDLWEVLEEGQRHPDDEEVKERGKALFEEWRTKYD